jgi:hypothetical protein
MNTETTNLVAKQTTKEESKEVDDFEIVKLGIIIMGIPDGNFKRVLEKEIISLDEDLDDEESHYEFVTSHRDFKFVKDIAKKHNIPLFVNRYYEHNTDNGESPQYKQNSFTIKNSDKVLIINFD